MKTIVALSVIGFMVTVSAHGQSTVNVNATVTVENISVEITSDGSVAYGTLGLSDTLSTLGAELNDTQTARNNGNVTAKLNIRGSNSAAWTLSDGASVDEDVYMHEYSTNGSFPGTKLHPSTYKTLAASVAIDATQDFDLQIHTPSSSSSFDEQSVNVTVQAAIPD